MEKKKNKVLIGAASFGEIEPKLLDKLIRNGFEIVKNPFGRKLTSPELRELLTGVIGLIAGLEAIDREILRNSNLKVVSRLGVGLDNIDMEAAKEFGIIVKNTPRAPTISVAELTVGSMLGLLRKLPKMNEDLHEKKWNQQLGTQLLGKNILIIGFGRIGSCVARLLEPFNVKISAVDPAYSGIVKGVPIVSIDEALPGADIICLHLSGTTQVLGKEEFSKIKKGVLILNAARGGVIDEQGLEQAIKEEKVAGAWLDVFVEEPYTGPLVDYPQVILTPHAGSYTRECLIRMEREAVDNLLSVLIK